MLQILKQMSVLFVHNSMPADASSGKKKLKPSCLGISGLISHSHAMISESICSRFGNAFFSVAE
jgi:hypothetical protein